MKYLLLTALLILGGCATPPTITTYQVPGSTEAPWRIAGHKSNSGDRIDVTINDSLVCIVDVGPMTSSDEAKAEYKGRKVFCTLQRTSGLTGSGLLCMVMIDGALAAKFEFRD